ncbi:hypothetical protein E8E14_008285 [Neopestalotiopsis sp. 37M]|jgi:hypothetical protein|nr:hypothetical protein E8E14_008285 [Neopestalotiopsis sp. 37M]
MDDVVGYVCPLLWFILGLGGIRMLWVVIWWPQAILVGLVYLRQQAILLGQELSLLETEASPLQRDVLDLGQKVVLIQAVMMKQWAQYPKSMDDDDPPHVRYRITVDGERVPILETLLPRPCPSLDTQEALVTTSSTPDDVAQIVVEPTMTDEWTGQYLDLIHRVFQVDWEDFPLDEAQAIRTEMGQNMVARTDEWIGEYLALVHRIFRIDLDGFSVDNELRRLICEEMATRDQVPVEANELCSHLTEM